MTDMGLTNYLTRQTARKLERAAMAGFVNEARDRKTTLRLETTKLCEIVDGLLYAGVAKDAIAEALAGLMDAIVNADYAACKTIDDAGEYSETLDMTEAAALLEKVSA